MASATWADRGGSRGTLVKPTKIAVALHSSDHVHCKTYFDPETSEAILTFVDDDDTHVDIVVGVRQMTPALRALLKEFEGRLEQLPA